MRCPYVLSEDIFVCEYLGANITFESFAAGMNCFDIITGVEGEGPSGGHGSGTSSFMHFLDMLLQTQLGCEFLWTIRTFVSFTCACHWPSDTLSIYL